MAFPHPHQTLVPISASGAVAQGVISAVASGTSLLHRVRCQLVKPNPTPTFILLLPMISKVGRTGLLSVMNPQRCKPLPNIVFASKWRNHFWTSSLMVLTWRLHGCGTNLPFASYAV